MMCVGPESQPLGMRHDRLSSAANGIHDSYVQEFSAPNTRVYLHR